MKAKEVMKLLDISRATLFNYTRDGSLDKQSLSKDTFSKNRRFF
jgi:predicted site-specific integrase-resolvase